MPKNDQKNQPKKSKTKNNLPKPQPKTGDITSNKFYWIGLTLLMVVFGSIYGYEAKVAPAAIGMLLGSVLALIGFAFYLKFKPSTVKYSNRAVFIFIGASVIGFSIFATIVLLSDITGIEPQIASSISVNFFAVTALIICLVLGGVIGDLIGDNKERMRNFIYDKFRR